MQTGKVKTKIKINTASNPTVHHAMLSKGCQQQVAMAAREQLLSSGPHLKPC